MSGRRGRWNEWVLLVCDIEKNTKGLLCSKSPMCTLSQNGYSAHKVAVGLNLLGLPMKNCLRQCLGQGLRLEVILLSNEKAAAPDPSPEAGRGRPRQASREASRQVSRQASRLELPTLRLTASRSNQLSYMEASAAGQNLCLCWRRGWRTVGYKWCYLHPARIELATFSVLG